MLPDGTLVISAIRWFKPAASTHAQVGSRMYSLSSRLFAGCLALALAGPPGYRAAAADGVTVQQAWARASAGTAITGAAYVTLMGGDQPDSLVGASTPVAATAEVHETTNDNGIMKMRPVGTIAIPPHQMVTLSPGGYHVMMTGLKHKLVAGESFPLTLTFTHTAPITVDVKVQAVGSAPPMDHMKM
jgi:copper(I)-binding protein